MRILIRGGAVLPLGGVEEVREATDLLVEDGRIAALGPALRPAAPPDRVIEARDRLVIPGLVNAHLHSHNNYFRGRFERMPLDLCVLEAWSVGGSPERSRLTPRELYARALLGCAEMLRTGTTTALDDVNLFPTLDEPSVAAVVQAYEDAGMRAVVAPHVFDVPYHRTVPFVAELLPPRALAALEAMRPPDPAATLDVLRGCAARWGGSDRRVRIGVGPSGPQRCSPGLLRDVVALAEERDLPLFIHVLETRTQAALGRVAYRKTLVEHLRDLEVLRPRVSVGHAVWLTPHDVEILAATGVTVCHNPVSNLRLGSGIAPVDALVRAGVPLALGTDGVMSNDSLNLFEAMKLAAMLPAVRDPDPERWLSARQALGMATAGGARSGRIAGIGAIAVGARADLVLLDLRRAGFAPRNDLVRQAVYADAGSSVDTVLVDGRVVVEGGRVLTVDEAAVAAEVTRDAAAFHARRAAGAPGLEDLAPCFREAYRRCWAVDVGVEAVLAPWPDPDPARPAPRA
jgi:cytosine/adenosine deaminase-related metal-dependent hydrolase